MAAYGGRDKKGTPAVSIRDRTVNDRVYFFSEITLSETEVCDDMRKDITLYIFTAES